MRGLLSRGPGACDRCKSPRCRFWCSDDYAVLDFVAREDYILRDPHDVFDFAFLSSAVDGLHAAARCCSSVAEFAEEAIRRAESRYPAAVMRHYNLGLDGPYLVARIWFDDLHERLCFNNRRYSLGELGISEEDIRKAIVVICRRHFAYIGQTRSSDLAQDSAGWLYGDMRRFDISPEEVDPNLTWERLDLLRAQVLSNELRQILYP